MSEEQNNKLQVEPNAKLYSFENYLSEYAYDMPYPAFLILMPKKI